MAFAPSRELSTAGSSLASVPPESDETGRRFRDASPAARAFLLVIGLAAFVLPFVVIESPAVNLSLEPGALALIYVGCSVAGLELGRWLEGRTVVEQRPHKALSAWAFASAMTLAPLWLLAIVPLTYGHAYWRGLRPAPWKWIGSGAFVVLAGLGAHEAIQRLDVNDRGLTGPLGLLAVLTGLVAFLVIESALFFAISRLNHRAQEEWLRATLAGRSFYGIEAGVLGVGALSGLVWATAPWFGVLLAPVYGLLQHAALFEPLRTEAATDDKTGLLRYDAWRQRAAREIERLERTGQPWAVMLLDLDHFKAYNDNHGHVVADETLVACADEMRRQVRRSDVVGRFGGEEFVIFLVDLPCGEASEVADRVRRAIGCSTVPRVTASTGVAWVSGNQPVALQHVIALADRALYAAKSAGRDRVVLHEA